VPNHWGLSQALTLALIALGIVVLFQRFGVDGVLRIGLVALGLGFVIFIHELGHFAVAKWCDVHVETFSIGFGPAIPGCTFRRGETEYKIAWFPLGGYVKMVGEGTESEEYGEDYPRSFKNKSVGQRMAIISAGVIMNVIFGCLFFIFVYRMHGVERTAATVDQVDTHSPAWVDGARTGAVIDQIGKERNPHFMDLRFTVMLSTKDVPLPFVTHEPGQPPVETTITPRKDKGDLYPVIGITPPSELKLFPRPREVVNLPVVHDSAAAQAQPAFEWGDAIIAMTDPADPSQVTEIPTDPRYKTFAIPDYFEFRRRMKVLEGKPVTVRILRQDQDSKQPPRELDIRIPPAYHFSFGMRMQIGQVTAIRHHSPAEKAHVQARDVGRGTDGDLITEVEVTRKDGQKLRYVTSHSKTPDKGVLEQDLDPLRLPDELGRWAEEMGTTKRVVHLKVSRAVPNDKPKEFPLDVDWDDSWRYNREVPFSLQSPLSIPELGLAYQVTTTVDDVAEGSPADVAGIRRLDVIKGIRFMTWASKPGERVSGQWKDLESDQWAHAFWSLQETEFKEVTLRVARGKETQEVHLFALADHSWPKADRGLTFLPESHLQKADTLSEALLLGLHDTYYNITQIYMNLKAMITGRVSVKTVGGPIMIATVAYDVAGRNIYQFMLFLAMISINLAVVNFLPIPILDGGHMVFLIWEKIKGGPVSEAVRTYATMVGLAVILFLMVFTFWMDIARWW
jgi:regulator of sigma E protease